MKKILFLTATAIFFLTTTSCKKTCFREVVYPDGTKVTEQYEAVTCDPSYGGGGTGTGCTTCGTGGSYVVFDPNAYQPEWDQITVPGTVINAPERFWSNNAYHWRAAPVGSTDFEQRKMRQNLASFAAIPDLNRDRFVDAGSDWDNKMVIWVYTDQYGAIEVMVDANRVVSFVGLEVGSTVDVTISFSAQYPYGVKGVPEQQYKNQPMSAITGKGIYGKI